MIKIYKIKKKLFEISTEPIYTHIKYIRCTLTMIIFGINLGFMGWRNWKSPKLWFCVGFHRCGIFFYLIRKFTLLISELVSLRYVVLIFWVIYCCCLCFQHNTVIYEAVHPLTSFSLFPYFIIHSCDHKRKRVRKKAL